MRSAVRGQCVNAVRPFRMLFCKWLSSTKRTVCCAEKKLGKVICPDKWKVSNWYCLQTCQLCTSSLCLMLKVGAQQNRTEQGTLQREVGES